MGGEKEEGEGDFYRKQQENVEKTHKLNIRDSTGNNLTIKTQLREKTRTKMNILPCLLLHNPHGRPQRRPGYLGPLNWAPGKE